MKKLKNSLFSCLLMFLQGCSSKDFRTEDLLVLHLQKNFDVAFGQTNTDKCKTLRATLADYQPVNHQKYLLCADISNEKGWFVYRLREQTRSSQDSPGTLIYDQKYQLIGIGFSRTNDNDLNDIQFVMLQDL